MRPTAAQLAAMLYAEGYENDDPRDPGRLDELGEPIMPAWWRRLASWWAWTREPDPAPVREHGVVVEPEVER